MNIKQRIHAVLFVLAVVLLAVPQAAASGFDGKFYLLAAGGQADTRSRISPVDEIDGDDTAWEIGAGYAIHANVGIEIRYHDYGKPSGFAGCPVDVLCLAIVPFYREAVSVDGRSAAVRGSIPFAGRFAVFGRVGVLDWDASARNPVLRDSGTDWLYGVGLAARLNDRIGLHLAYEKADVEIESVKLGFDIRF